MAPVAMSETRRSARALLPLVLPALLIGAGSSLLLLVVSELANALQDVLWDEIPSALGASGTSAWWIILVLTVTGAAVGLVVWKIPGHAGPDPATQSLVSPPLPVMVVPGLLLTIVLGLAGGVSLGPENPIMAASIALTLVLGRRFIPGVPPPQWVALGAAGMIGAMFGTPVAAALLLSEMPAGASKAPLWDRLFAPLVAAAAGSLTTTLLAQPVFSVAVTPYRGPEVIDLLSGSAIALVAAAIGLAAVYAFPLAHGLFQRIRNPMVMLTAGGVLLGVLGAIGGSITLFKGLEEMKELASTVADYTSVELVVVLVVKLAAVVIAATCGFRGGRIFPAVFLGVAVGLLANSLVPEIPPALCVAAGVLGMVLAIARDGWLSLFMAVIVVPDITLLPIMVVAILPAWLLLTGKPEMLIRLEPAREAP